MRSVSEPVAHARGTFWDYDYVTKSPFATFNFKYRSIGTLKQSAKGYGIG